jgi:MFS family permease
MIEILRKRFEFMNMNMRILTIRQVLAMFTYRMAIPYSSLYILELGGNKAQIGLINSLLPLAGLVIFPISGYYTDRTGRVKLIALAGYLSALTWLLYVFAPSWEWIALGTLLRGFMVFQFPPTSAILADSMNPKARGVGIATMMTLGNAFAIFSPYIAGIIIELYDINLGMRLLYASLVLALTINSTLILKYLRETTTIKKSETTQNILGILKDAYSGIPTLIQRMPLSVKALGVLIGMGFIANAIAAPFWVIYVIEIIGLSSIDWGLILLLESILKTFLTFPSGMIADRYSKRRIIFVAMLLSLISLPSLIFAKTFTHVLLIRLVAGLAGTLFVPSCTALLADFIPRDLRGRVMAAIGRGSVFIGATGGGIGGPGMGYIFTLPVIFASFIGGLLYSMNPIYPWLCILGTTTIQLLSVILFIRDPKQVEE